MRSKFILSLVAAVVVAAPALAVIAPFGDNLVPVPKSTVFPTLDEGTVGWWNFQRVQVSGDSVGYLSYRDDLNNITMAYPGVYNTQTDTLIERGKNPNGTFDIPNLAWVAAWAPWTQQFGLNGDYLAYNTISPYGGTTRYQISTGTSTPIVNNDAERHFVDVNGSGIVATQTWDSPTFTSIVVDPATYNPADVAGTALYRTLQGDEFGQTPRLGGNVVAWNGQTADDYQKYIHNLSTGTTTLIWSSPLADTAVKPRMVQISNDGSKIVMPIFDTTNLVNGNEVSKIMLYDIATGTWSTVVDDGAVDRESSVDGDYLVWHRVNANGSSDIWGLNLSTSQKYLIAGNSTGETYKLINPEVDAGGLVAWVQNGARNGNAYSNVIHYAMIPEPASLSLLALGGLALLRRRNA